jgi:hypothetical protein
MAGYLASYYDVDMQKVGDRIVTGDERIVYLFHVYGSNNVKYFFPYLSPPHQLTI